MKAAPALPLFGDAYLADTRHLSLEEHGAYLQLLLIAWRSDGCRLPDNDKRVSQMLGITQKRWAKIKPIVMAFWTLKNGFWEQGRLTKERRFVAKKSEQNSGAANARWHAKPLKNNEPDDADASSMQCERNAPSPSPIKEEEKVMPDKSGDYAFFGQTIKLAPRHLKEWKRLFSTILDLEAEISTIDDWWQLQPEAKRTNWFIATKGMLNKRHQENLAAKARAEDDDAWKMMP